MIKKLLSLGALSVLITASAVSGVMAARQTPAPTGNDISFPQCGRTLPKGQAFGIVGVNGGTATKTNPCLSDQLKWAMNSSGAVPAQPKIQLYVNTANPGEVLEKYAVDSWPFNNIDKRGNDTLTSADLLKLNPYGECKTTQGNYRGYTNDLACSWQYGWNRSVEAVDDRFAPAARTAGINAVASAYTWWLDVETMNSWQAEGTTGDSPERQAALARNTATLEGMKAFYTSEGATVGLYSTSYQWGLIVGKTIEAGTTGQNLKGLSSWLAGAANLADAQKRCASAPLTADGKTTMVQYVSKNLDYNYSCI